MKFNLGIKRKTDIFRFIDKSGNVKQKKLNTKKHTV